MARPTTITYYDQDNPNGVEKTPVEMGSIWEAAQRHSVVAHKSFLFYNALTIAKWLQGEKYELGHGH